MRPREGNAGRWKDAEVLAAALLDTEEGVRELDSGDAAGPWFDQAHGLLEGLPDEARRRRLLSRWTLAVAARFNAAYDGRRSRDLLDAAARELPDDADVLDADARVHAAIAERPYSGLGETVRPSEEVDAVRPDLARALQLYERVLRLQADRSEARLRRGRVLLLLRRTGDARAQLEPLVSPAEVPLAALLVLDTSTSVAGAKLEQLERASLAFLAGLAPRDQALLLTFSHELQLQAPLTSDREVVRRALSAVAAGGRTSINDTLFSALLVAPRLPGRPVVVVFSDGEDTSSWLGPGSALQAARESDTLVFAVGAGAHSLRELTSLTGGRCIAADGAGLREAFERVVSELRTRYLLRFTPHGTSPGWHRIRVRTRAAAADVRARPGYWRPARASRGD